MELHESKHVDYIGLHYKRQVTAIFCGTLVGDFLPVQLVYKGKTTHSHPCFAFPVEWAVNHSPNHWSTETTMITYINNMIEPYV